MAFQKSTGWKGICGRVLIWRKRGEAQPGLKRDGLRQGVTGSIHPRPPCGRGGVSREGFGEVTVLVAREWAPVSRTPRTSRCSVDALHGCEVEGARAAVRRRVPPTPSRTTASASKCGNGEEDASITSVLPDGQLCERENLLDHVFGILFR